MCGLTVWYYGKCLVTARYAFSLFYFIFFAFLCCRQLIISHQSPYIGMTNKEASDYVLKGSRLTVPPKSPPPFVALIKRCWRFYPEERPSFKDISF